MLLAGRYRLKVPPGMGPAAVLYGGQDERFERSIWAHLVGSESKHDTARGGALLARVAREARVLGSTSHPGLVRVLDLDLDHTPPFVVFEGIPGELLSTWLARRETPSLEAWVAWTRSLFEAVGEVHRQGFLLRDIRPDAVMVSEGSLRLLGLGEWRSARGNTERRTTVPDTERSRVSPYLAPEVLTEAAADPRADLYSAAALAYRILSGSDPIPLEEDLGPTDAILRLVHGCARPVDELRPDVPSAISAFLERALRKAPGERLQSAEDHVRALDGVLRASITPVDLGSPQSGSWVPEVGETVAGYTIYSVLGHGSAGTVLLARDPTLGRNVAIKLLRSCDDASVRDGALAEARSMAQVTHPNVVQVYGVSTHAGHPCIIMEYVPGPTLQDLLNEREGHLGYARIGSIVEQIASGLQAIHDAGFVHGDVKPSNVLLGPAGRVCVTDLGLARRTETYTPRRVDQLEGTAEFLAPERITGELRPELACRTDIYALAVLAYELVGGCLPFRGANAFALAHQHVTATPQPLGELRDDVPAALQLCVMQGLTKDPESRTPSCALFRDAFLAGLRAPEPEQAQMGPVLVVDDDPDFCELLAEVVRLELNPSAVDVVYRGKDALAAIEARAYAVVLLDLSLPDVGATELAARIGAALTSPPPIVVITGQGTAADWQELSALGVKGFHLKPIIPAALAAHVRHVVSAAS